MNMNQVSDPVEEISHLFWSGLFLENKCDAVKHETKKLFLLCRSELGLWRSWAQDGTRAWWDVNKWKNFIPGWQVEFMEI